MHTHSTNTTRTISLPPFHRQFNKQSDNILHHLYSKSNYNSYTQKTENSVEFNLRYVKEGKKEETQQIESELINNKKNCRHPHVARQSSLLHVKPLE